MLYVAETRRTMRPATTLRTDLDEIRRKLSALLEKKGGSLKNGLQEGECAKIVQFASKLKDPLDGRTPSPIPPVRRVVNGCAWLVQKQLLDSRTEGTRCRPRRTRRRRMMYS